MISFEINKQGMLGAKPIVRRQCLIIENNGPLMSDLVDSAIDM